MKPKVKRDETGKSADDYMRDVRDSFRKASDHADRKLTRRIPRATGEIEAWPDDERPTLTTLPDIDSSLVPAR